MPNLTVFGQQIAGREHLGIATALLQSLRMVGGMLGTAIVGTMVGHLYASQITDTLDGHVDAASLAQLSDPRVLVDAESQTHLLAQWATQHLDGSMILDTTRAALVAAIHSGMGVSLVVALISLWFVRRMPLIRLERRVPTPAAGD